MPLSLVHRSVIGLGLLGLLPACTTASLNSLTDLPEERGKVVHAQAENWNILLQGTNNDYNTEMMEQLAKACPNSPVKVSLVENRHTFYLLTFLFKDQVSAYGYCGKPNEKGG